MKGGRRRVIKAYHHPDLSSSPTSSPSTFRWTWHCNRLTSYHIHNTKNFLFLVDFLLASFVFLSCPVHPTPYPIVVG